MAAPSADEPPWDRRFVEWLQEDARHKKAGPARGPLTRPEVVGYCTALAVLCAFGVATGVGWPALALGIGFVGRLVQSRNRAGAEAGIGT